MRSLPARLLAQRLTLQRVQLGCVHQRIAAAVRDLAAEGLKRAAPHILLWKDEKGSAHKLTQDKGRRDKGIDGK